MSHLRKGIHLSALCTTPKIFSKKAVRQNVLRVRDKCRHFADLPICRQNKNKMWKRYKKLSFFYSLVFWRVSHNNFMGVLFAGPSVSSFSIVFTRVSCPSIFHMILSYILQEKKNQSIFYSLFRDQVDNTSTAKPTNQPLYNGGFLLSNNNDNS